MSHELTSSEWLWSLQQIDVEKNSDPISRMPVFNLIITYVARAKAIEPLCRADYKWHTHGFDERTYCVRVRVCGWLLKCDKGFKQWIWAGIYDCHSLSQMKIHENGAIWFIPQHFYAWISSVWRKICREGMCAGRIRVELDEWNLISSIWEERI